MIFSGSFAPVTGKSKAQTFGYVNKYTRKVERLVEWVNRYAFIGALLDPEKGHRRGEFLIGPGNLLTLDNDRPGEARHNLNILRKHKIFHILKPSTNYLTWDLYCAMDRIQQKYVRKRIGASNDDDVKRIIREKRLDEKFHIIVIIDPSNLSDDPDVFRAQRAAIWKQLQSLGIQLSDLATIKSVVQNTNPWMGGKLWRGAVRLTEVFRGEALKAPDPDEVDPYDWGLARSASVRIKGRSLKKGRAPRVKVKHHSGNRYWLHPKSEIGYREVGEHKVVRVGTLARKLKKLWEKNPGTRYTISGLTCPLYSEAHSGGPWVHGQAWMQIDEEGEISIREAGSVHKNHIYYIYERKKKGKGDRPSPLVAAKLLPDTRGIQNVYRENFDLGDIGDQTLILVASYDDGEALEKELISRGIDARHYYATQDEERETWHHTINDRIGDRYDFEKRQVVILSLSKYQMIYETELNGKFTYRGGVREHLDAWISRIIGWGLHPEEIALKGVSFNLDDVMKTLLWAPGKYRKRKELGKLISNMAAVFLGEGESVNEPIPAGEWHENRWRAIGMDNLEMDQLEKMSKVRKRPSRKRLKLFAEMLYIEPEDVQAPQIPQYANSVADLLFSWKSIMDSALIYYDLELKILAGQRPVRHPVKEILCVLPNPAPTRGKQLPIEELLPRMKPGDIWLTRKDKLTARQLAWCKKKKIIPLTWLKERFPPTAGNVVIDTDFRGERLGSVQKLLYDKDLGMTQAFVGQVLSGAQCFASNGFLTQARRSRFPDPSKVDWETAKASGLFMTRDEWRSWKKRELKKRETPIELPDLIERRKAWVESLGDQVLTLTWKEVKDTGLFKSSREWRFFKMRVKKNLKK